MTENTALATSQPQHPIVAALDQRLPAIADMLGDAAAANRFKRVVIQAVIKNPDLMNCSPNSIVDAVMDSAAIGIEPTGTLGGAYLVPYGRKATLIVGYRGLIELARRSGEIDSIEAHVVREGDEFEYEYGTNAHVRHVPQLDAPADRPLTYVYGVARLRGGAVQFEVMTRAQVDAIRSRSASGRSGPWATDYDEMARKTVVRRLVKYLPIAVEARDVIERDDADFDPGAVVARVATRSDGLRDKIGQRTAALRGEQVVDEPPTEPDEEEQAPEPALDSLPFEQPAGAVSNAGSLEASSVAPAGSCSHPERQRVVDSRGVVCGACGAVLARRGADAGDDLPDIPGDPEPRQALMKRLHAAYGLDHEGVRDIAAALLKQHPDDFSLAALSEEQLEGVDKFLSALTDDVAQRHVAQKAIEHGMATEAKVWELLDVLAVSQLGKQPDQLKPAEWVHLGIRITRGELDEPQQAPDPNVCPDHGEAWQLSPTGKSGLCPTEGCNRRAPRPWVDARLLAAV